MVNTSTSPASSSSSSTLNFKLKSIRLQQIVESNSFIEIENAFRGNLKTYFYKNTNNNYKDICLLLDYIKLNIVTILSNIISMFGPIKFNIVVECTYIKPVINETQDRSFKTKNVPIIDNNNLNMTINNAIRDICYDEDIYMGKGSGWSLHRIDGILLRINRFKPLRLSLIHI